MGISGKMEAARQRMSVTEYNKLSVKLELQADCLAEFWAHHANRTRQILQQGDVEEAIHAATAIGEDRLQQQSCGYVTPESFTHGSCARRGARVQDGAGGRQNRRVQHLLGAGPLNHFTVLRASIRLSSTRFNVQIQRAPSKSSGKRV
jgi:predicted metalloprotease